MLHIHNLVWPIEDDKGQQLNHVQIHTITVGQQRELSRNHQHDDNQLLWECVCLSTGLTPSELKKLVTPDFNSIREHVLELMQSGAATFMADEFNRDEPTLLIPIQGDDGQEKTHYKLRPPTVATTELMETHQDEWERTLFISASCCGFSHQELMRLSLPDWNQLQERLIDFLQQPADYFRQEMLKS